MKHRLSLTASPFPAIAVALALSCQAIGASAAPAGRHGRPCHLPGSEEPLRCIDVPVALDHQAPQGATLTLHVTLAPAFREAAKRDPLFVLAGGPGQAGSDTLMLLDASFRKVRATRDIVFIDQRGTGLSGKLDCANKDAHETLSEAQLADVFKQCIKNLKQPFAHFNTEQSARDVEQVRLAMGYDQINLWGSSYGTRLAQAYARRYPTGARALILDGVASPEQIVPAGGRDGQAALEAVFQQCAKDQACAAAYPGLRAEFDTLLARARAGTIALDFPHPRTALPTRRVLSNRIFTGTVHSVLYSAPDSRRLPFLIHSAYQGNWGPFLARGYAATDFSLEGPVASVMHLAVICAEDVPRLSPELLVSDERNSFLAGSAKRIADLCPLINVPAIAWRAPVRLTAPALLLSGALDPVTPPHRAASAANLMPSAQHIVVANAGHGISHLGCAPRLLREFLDQPFLPLAAQCLTQLPAGSFQLGSAGAQP